MPEFLDPVFAKTSPKRAFLVIENERFGHVFARTGFINSGTAESLLCSVVFTRIYTSGPITLTVLLDPAKSI